MSEWVSVKDRLPEPDAYVLIFISEGYQNPIRTIAWSSAMYSSRAPFPFRCITHWRPLPDPPTREGAS